VCEGVRETASSRLILAAIRKEDINPTSRLAPAPELAKVRSYSTAEAAARGRDLRNGDTLERRAVVPCRRDVAIR
jgi:hypothetical protein